MNTPRETFLSRFCVLVVLLLSVLALSACSSGGKAAFSVGPTGAPASISITITPSAVSPGQSATLTWSTANATSCTASGAWTGTQPMSGAMNVSLQGTTSQTYKLLCEGGGAYASQTATLGLASSAAACTTQAARAHRVPVSQAVLAARRAVAAGKAGKKPVS